jgi:hypothetical protein
VLVVIAVIGILIIVPSPGAIGISGAVLLGIFVGATGGQALALFLEKAPKTLGLAARAPAAPSPLLSIAGITLEHALRFEEEGVFSVQDLAYAPTARLFFNTPYGLQAICEWQDEALLIARFGGERAGDLASQTGIRTMTELARTASDLLKQPGGAVRDALHRALRLEAEAPVDPLLKAIVEDETMLRLQVHRQSVVLKPAQFDEIHETSAGARQITVFAAAKP